MVVNSGQLKRNRLYRDWDSSCSGHVVGFRLQTWIGVLLMICDMIAVVH